MAYFRARFSVGVACRFSVGAMARFRASEAAHIPETFCDPERNVNADKYVEMLTVRPIPNILDTCGNLDTATWQQGIAKARPGNKATAFVDSKIKNSLKWPARSPDLGPLDYVARNYIKDTARSSLADVSKPDEARSAIEEARGLRRARASRGRLIPSQKGSKDA